MNEYVFTLRLTDAPALATVRHLPQLQAATDDACVWLRIDGPADKAVWQLPAQQRYLANADGVLFPVGHVTPIGKLPKLKWKKLTDFMPLKPPVSAMPGIAQALYTVKLVPSTKDHDSAALFVTFDAWQHYVLAAPAARLARLRFAVSERREVLILGTPLPPLPGLACWRQNDLILPTGWDFEAPFLGELVTRRLNPQGDAILYIDTAGHWQRILHTQFVPASRSAVRHTQTRLADV
ncbi:hypothetical protein [Parachryseolinea silvisoli]|uniref:hypothetical protein n=1 Tax=Parachryseolinea silvisoli TaxID=2873601 RepID=UPI002265F85D|nr:hypothetical protein [Parachryseolinea silvisoli]MCD9015550.1 hypothetical protein [Parachryseolinea silvisoli]